MYKNQLQELAQRSCFNLPSYSCVREGPDHAPRFKATVNFNGETFESPSFCSTLRQAEHAAAEVALHTLACRGPSRALATRVLDETGVYKNLLQETAHRAGLKLPVYTTIRTGPRHIPIFSCTVELAGMSFTGEAARTKKQAQKNAAIAAWSSLKRLVQHGSPSSSSPSSSSSSSSSSSENVKSSEEQEQVVIARFLASIQPTDMKNFKPNFSHGDLTPPTASLYPLQYQNWACPGFPPEMAIYQPWQQEHLLQLQNQFSTLRLLPSPPPAPRIFQYIPPILPLNSHLVVPLREQEPVPANPRITIASSGPLLCFPENDTSGKSTVTIQEIHEEKTEELPMCSPSMPLDPPVQLQSIQLRGNQTEQIERPSSTDVRLRVQNPQSYAPSRYNPRSSIAHRPPPSIAPPVMIRSTRPRPPSAASPVQIRNIGPVSLRTRQPDLGARGSVPPRLRTGNTLNSSRPLSPRFMAPAVRIRSVVPVCSAPPARKMATTAPEGALAGKDRNDAVSEEKSTRRSEL